MRRGAFPTHVDAPSVARPARLAVREIARVVKGAGYSRPDRTDRPMYDVVCARCGKPTQVPFQPRNDRPVYCRDCYEKQRQ